VPNSVADTDRTRSHCLHRPSQNNVTLLPTTCSLERWISEVDS
jgi:hypothetical protein